MILALAVRAVPKNNKNSGVAESGYFQQLGYCWKIEAKLADKSGVVMSCARFL